MKPAEKRIWVDCELRIEDGETPKIMGYAAKYNAWSVDLGGFREIIRPGAFSRAISEQQDVRALVDHDASMILGRTKSGTLRMTEDSVGLRVEIDPPDTSIARDVMQSIRRGDIDGMSFGFVTRKDEWRHNKGGEMQRELIDVDLFDVSVVTYPAYPDTSVAMRSLEVWKKTSPDAETYRRRVAIERAR